MLRKCPAGLYFIFALMILSAAGCRKHYPVHPAFYYWKTSFELNPVQADLLKDAASGTLYLRFFDVVWNEEKQTAFPNAVLNLKQKTAGLEICPVIYMTNQTFEHTKADDTDSLAFKVNKLTTDLAKKYQISFDQVQIDCDWTQGTRNSYFAFLKAFKKYSAKQLQATIRLHQVKYPERTGVPPVDKGVLMFYNMGKLSPGLNARNSIYNKQDAGSYVSHAENYPLPLDVALPFFSWSLQIRAGKIIQIYGKISSKQLAVTSNFEKLTPPNVYRSRASFYLEGIYVKEGDLFKLEEIKKSDLLQAAAQLSASLKPLKNRNIIYYEISSTNFSSLNAKDIQEVSAHF